MKGEKKYETMEEIADNLICYLGKERFREFPLFEDITDTRDVLVRRPEWRTDWRMDVNFVPRADAAKYGGRILAWRLPDVMEYPYGHLRAIEAGFEPVFSALMDSGREFSYLYVIMGNWYPESIRARMVVFSENRVIFIGRGFDYDEEQGPKCSGDSGFDISVCRLSPEEFIRRGGGMSVSSGRDLFSLDLSGQEAAKLVCEALDEK